RADLAASARNDANVSGLSAIACQASNPSNSRAMKDLPHLFYEVCEHDVGAVPPFLGEGRMRVDLAERFGDRRALENLGLEQEEFRVVLRRFGAKPLARPLMFPNRPPPRDQDMRRLLRLLQVALVGNRPAPQIAAKRIEPVG